MPIHITDLFQPADECVATLQDAMTLLVARYPEAVFSDIVFDHEPTIWVWRTNAASQNADTAQAIAWLRQTPAPEGACMSKMTPRTAQDQLSSQSWTTIDDIRDRVSRHGDLMNHLVSTMLNQEILLERLVTIAEHQTRLLAALHQRLASDAAPAPEGAVYAP